MTDIEMNNYFWSLSWTVTSSSLLCEIQAVINHDRGKRSDSPATPGNRIKLNINQFRRIIYKCIESIDLLSKDELDELIPIHKSSCIMHHHLNRAHHWRWKDFEYVIFWLLYYNTESNYATYCIFICAIMTSRDASGSSGGRGHRKKSENAIWVEF